MTRSVLHLLLGLLCFTSVAGPPQQGALAAEQMDLAGTWRFRLDPDDRGTDARWFQAELPDVIRLPGVLQAQGYGAKPGKSSQWLAGIGLKLADDPRFQPYMEDENFRCPFFLTPPRHYVGPAWYQREVEIPHSWADRRVVLFLERAHWKTTVWVDQQQVGSCDALATPHVYDLTGLLTPGKHRLTICVDNRYIIPVGTSAHSISDETQGNWNGLVGRIELQTTPKVWIDQVQLFPNVAQRAVRLRVHIGNATAAAGEGQLTVWAEKEDQGSGRRFQARVFPVGWDASGATVTLNYPLGKEAELWDEFNPALYRLHVQLVSTSRPQETHEVTEPLGLREATIEGTQFVINGRPIFLRGTLECCIFPLTGHPPMDVESWRRILLRARQFGLNHLRFHSWCPPEAAFIAADQLGFYYQVECSCWARFGDGTAVDDFVYREAERIRRHYGNHPSLLLMAASNEPHGNSRDEFLTRWVLAQREADPRRFYTAGSGWPRLEVNQYEVQSTTRLQRWQSLQLSKPPQTWDDYRQYVERLGKPTVSHEIGQWCVYPNVVNEPEKYTGFFRGANLEVFREILANSGMAHRANDFLLASGRFQTILYKQEIESALRTPGMAGFQLLDLHDFPGQGTAPVGVLDAFWDPKPYVTAEQYRRFCNSTVPLARLKKLVWTTDETLQFQLDVAHYGPGDLENALLTWRLDCGSRPIASGKASGDLPTGKVTSLGSFSVPLGQVEAPAKLSLCAAIEGTGFANDWNVWVYPAEIDTEVPNGITLTNDPAEAWEKANAGGAVVLLVPAGRVAGDTLGTFQPIFWNRITFPSQKVHTVGIWCDEKHPALARFPTEFHADWQWEDLLDHCKPMVLGRLPAELVPIVQPIDDWCNARKLGLVFEARAGRGKLLVCSIDLQNDLADRPVARQLRHSLLAYVSSPQFSPKVALDRNQWESLFREPRLLEKLQAVATADSYQQGYEPGRALDGDPATMWHTAWIPRPSPMPHHLVVELKQPVMLLGITLLGRQDNNPNGRIAQYEVYTSADGETWGEPLASGTLPNTKERQTIRFPKPQQTRFIKLRVLREVNGRPFASLAEFDLLVQ